MRPRAPRRRGFGDALWELADHGDIDALAGAAAFLAAPDEPDYDASRARAFALATTGAVDAALAELNDGWTEEWPTPPMYATDVARVRLLAGDSARAVDALDLAVRSAVRSAPATVDLAVRCVEREPRLWRAALRVVTRARGAGRASGSARVLSAAVKRRPFNALKQCD